MGQNLNDYLTGEERRQMDKLLAKAEERMRENGEEVCSEQILLMACQCKCRQMMQKEEGHDLCPEYCQEELPFP